MKKNRETGLCRLTQGFLPLLLALLFPFMAMAQNSRTVTGTVVDELGDPMVGVTVMETGTSNGTSTDVDGNFMIKVSSSAVSLDFSYIGYNKMTVAVASSPMKVTMTPNTKVMDEVVVIGYGTQKKSDLTGSISSVSEKDFNKGVISSPEQLVNGKIAGVQITNYGVSPTSSSTIRIR